MNEIIEDIATWMRVETLKAKAKGVVFGLSGGIDSAVVAGIAKRAFPKTALGIMIPIESDEEDLRDGKLVAESLSLNTKQVDLTDTFLRFKEEVLGDHHLALSNIKPRLRMTCLYYYAQSLNYLVLGCSNKSEFEMGYFTKYGDSGADLIPLASFYKSEVYKMGECLGIPQEIMKKPPSAGLWRGQTDEEEMGVSYGDIEKYLKGEEIPKDIYKKIDNMHKKSEHKRRFALIYKRGE